MFEEWLFEAAHIGSEAAYYGKGLLQSKFMFVHSGFSTVSNQTRAVIPPVKSIFYCYHIHTLCIPVYVPFTGKHVEYCWIFGSHGSGYEEYGLLGCNTL
jgi:hypothetical protein